MAEQALTFTQLFDWRDEETGRWKAFFAANPQALAVACDMAGAKTVRELVKHVFAAERYFSQRARDEEAASFQDMPEDVEAQFAIGETASRKLREYAAGASEAQLSEVLKFPFGPGFDASKRKTVVTFTMHGVRHWAQIASVVRTGGFKTDWQHDFLMSGAMQ